MGAKKQLRQKQLLVIDDLFSGELDEQAVLDKHKVSRNIYNKWLRDEKFCAEFSRRVTIARLQSEVLIAKYSLAAAAKLVQLTQSEKEETARKACLDIISLPLKGARKTEQAGGKPQENVKEEVEELSEQTCSRLLAALAEEEQPIKKD